MTSDESLTTTSKTNPYMTTVIAVTMNKKLTYVTSTTTGITPAEDPQVTLKAPTVMTTEIIQRKSTSMPVAHATT